LLDGGEKHFFFFFHMQVQFVGNGNEQVKNTMHPGKCFAVLGSNSLQVRINQRNGLPYIK